MSLPARSQNFWIPHWLHCKMLFSSSDGQNSIGLNPNSTWLVTSRLDTTRHVRRVEPMHFGCVELVEQQKHGSTRSTRRGRFARHDERDRRDSPRSLLCNLYTVLTFYKRLDVQTSTRCSRRCTGCPLNSASTISWPC